MTYEIIQTGSEGNATLINGCVLIDCGVPMKRLRPVAQALRLVLLTHEHGDHFRAATVSALARQRPTLRWGCCEWMAASLLEAGVDPRCIDIYRPIDAETEFLYLSLGIKVRPVKLTHNVPNCGYHILTLDGSDKTFYATDTGTLDGVEAKGYGLYLVEANHTRAEIEQRIAEKEARGEFCYERAAAENHLSYEQAVDWLTENMGPDSVWVPMHQHIDKTEKG